MSLLGPKETPIITDVNEAIEVDSQVINFGTFMPGKLLGSTLLVKNKTKQEQVIQMIMRADAKAFIVDDYLQDSKFNMFRDYKDHGELVETGKSLKHFKSKGEIVNSEKKHACWFLENPQNKELVKHITLKLGPECEQEFIVVVRAPTLPSMDSLFGSMELRLSTYEIDNPFLKKI